MVSEKKCDLTRVLMTYGLSMEKIDEVITHCRAHISHELAERIRAWADSDEIAVITQSATAAPRDVDTIVRGTARLMAQLIDSESLDGGE